MTYGIAFAKFMYDFFSFVSRNIKVFATLGSVIVAALFGAKVAGAVAALVKGIQAIITVMKALRTVSLASAAATALATGGVSAAAGAAAFAVALGAIGLATKKFTSDADKAADSVGKFKLNVKGLGVSAKDYTKGIDGITGATSKLTAAQKEDARVTKLLLDLQNKYKLSSKDLSGQSAITLEAVRKNQLKQGKLGLSSPSISLLASAGTNGTITNNHLLS